MPQQLRFSGVDQTEIGHNCRQLFIQALKSGRKNVMRVVSKLNLNFEEEKHLNLVRTENLERMKYVSALAQSVLKNSKI